MPSASVLYWSVDGLVSEKQDRQQKGTEAGGGSGAQG